MLNQTIEGLSKMSQTQTLIIDPKYLAFIPRPSEDRYNKIKIDIEQYGQQIAIITNQDNVILDGHTRYQICQELNIIPKTEKRTFDDSLQEERFVYAINLKRRDLSEFANIELSLKIHEIDAKIAQTNQIKGGKGFQISEKDKVNTTKTIAKETKKSIDTVSRVKKILDHSPDKEIQALREGKDGSSVNKSYKKIKKQEKKKKRQDEIKKIQVNLPKTIQLHNKPFQELNIKDNSISLIFTDPPYTQEFLHLYDDLAKQAARILRDGGSLMCYVGHYALNIILPMIEKHGLTFHWIIPVLHSGASSLMFDKKIHEHTNPYYGLQRENMITSKMLIKSEFQGKVHEWAKVL